MFYTGNTISIFRIFINVYFKLFPKSYESIKSVKVNVFYYDEPSCKKNDIIIYD